MRLYAGESPQKNYYCPLNVKNAQSVGQQTVYFLRLADTNDKYTQTNEKNRRRDAP